MFYGHLIYLSAIFTFRLAMFCLHQLPMKISLHCGSDMLHFVILEFILIEITWCYWLLNLLLSKHCWCRKMKRLQCPCCDRRELYWMLCTIKCELNSHCASLTVYISTLRVAGGLSIRCEPRCRVLWCTVGLKSGQPFLGDLEKNSPAMPAPDLPQLLGSLQTV